MIPISSVAVSGDSTAPRCTLAQIKHPSRRLRWKDSGEASQGEKGRRRKGGQPAAPAEARRENGGRSSALLLVDVIDSMKIGGGASVGRLRFSGFTLHGAPNEQSNNNNGKAH